MSLEYLEYRKIFDEKHYELSMVTPYLQYQLLKHEAVEL